MKCTFADQCNKHNACAYFERSTTGDVSLEYYTKLTRPVVETLYDRNKKYGGVYQKQRSEDSVNNPSGLLWEIRKKLARYKEALLNEEYETALDSLLDIAGYCVLEIDFLRTCTSHTKNAKERTI